MVTHLKHTLASVYRQHGLIAFLLFFIPLIPGFIEHHTLVYLKLIKALTGNQHHAEPAIQRVFGQRGINTLRRHLKPPFVPVTFTSIWEAFFNLKNPGIGCQLVNNLFFDNRERRLAFSDVIRTQVIQAIPDIFAVYNLNEDQLIRSTLIRKIALLACQEPALAPRQAIIDLVVNLLNNTSKLESEWRQFRSSNQMALISARIKAELVGRATAGDPAFMNLAAQAQTPPPHFLNQTDILLLQKTLRRLSQTDAIEIDLAATTAINQLRHLDLTLTN